MTKEEKLIKIAELKDKAELLKREADYYQAYQMAAKLILNGNFGALSTPYCILYSLAVGSTITACGREVIQYMEKCTNKYFREMWFDDKELHKKLCIKDVKNITHCVSIIYMDTDSIFSQTKINTDKGDFTIEDWYNNNIKNGSAGETTSGHESVLTEDKILNYDNGLYYAPVKRIIRHKVSKPKWKLKTKSGKEVIVTNDHSLVVVREGEQIVVKPNSTLITDKVITTQKLDEIESCEMIGEFEDEYVYDVEVDDVSHTFVANDILVHNSCFVSFEPIIKNCTWKNLVYSNLDKINKSFIIIYTKDIITTDNPLCEGIFEFDKELQIPIVDYVVVDGHLMKNKDFEEFTKNNQIADKLKWNWSDELYFIQAIDYYRIAGYYIKCLEEYAAGYGVESKHDFELERISESGIWLAKKKYILNNVFEDGIYYEKLSQIYNKGIEIVRRSTPLFARERVMEVINYLFKHPDDYNIKDTLKIVKNLKKEFQMCVPDKMDEISMQSSCNKYEQYVLQDKDKLNFATKTPASVKASAYYNYLLHKNKNMQSKYEFFKSGARIKYYYVKDTSVNKIFAFMRGSFPVEFAPEINVDIQFDKCILSPINTIIKHLNMPEITKRLSVLMDVFGDTIKKPQVVDEDNDLEKELEVDDNGDFVLELDNWDNLY